jgi:hypothetical protein
MTPTKFDHLDQIGGSVANSPVQNRGVGSCLERIRQAIDGSLKRLGMDLLFSTAPVEIADVDGNKELRRP